jgi:secreted trypsin-like serine protease
MMRFAVMGSIILAACGQAGSNGAMPDGSMGSNETDAAHDSSSSDGATCAYIIGGTTDSGDSAVGSIVVRQPGSSQWHVDCTATVIAPTYVLTAGHCVSPQVLGNLEIGFALGTDLTNVSDSQVHHEAHRYPNPMFNPQELSAGLATNVYDIAVLELSEPVNNVTPAKIVRPQDDAMIQQGTTVRIVGYGVTSNNGQDIGTKRSATTTLGTVQTAEMIVGVPGQPQKCNGDSGGPTFLDVIDHCVKTPRIIGTTSRAQDSNLNCQEPGIDTRVSYHLQWLGSVVPFSCDSGLNSTPCT